MRVLAHSGIGIELENKHFKKNNAMELLRRDNGANLGHIAAYFTGDENYTALRSLGKSVRECQPSFILEHGMNHFEYMNDIQSKLYSKEKMFQGLTEEDIGSDARRASLATTYDSSNEALSYLECLPDKQGINNIQHAFPWSKYKRIIDIAGSNGSFLATILNHSGCQHIQGFVVELPNVVQEARQNAKSLGVTEDRLKFIIQDVSQPFNRSTLGIDVVDAITVKNYIGMFIDHSDLILNIFKCCSDVLSKETGRLLVIDMCSAEPGDVTRKDEINGLQHSFETVHWINITGGSLRPKSEFINILKRYASQADFRFEHAYDTFRGGYTIFEFSHQ